MANCADCGKHMTFIFRDGNDYSYLECDWCLEEFCDKCCTVDEDTGLCKCNGCIQQEQIDMRNGREPKQPIIGAKSTKEAEK